MLLSISPARFKDELYLFDEVDIGNFGEYDVFVHVWYLWHTIDFAECLADKLREYCDVALQYETTDFDHIAIELQEHRADVWITTLVVLYVDVLHIRLVQYRPLLLCRTVPRTRVALRRRSP